MTKPPYRVPLMSEVAQIPPNGLKVATTFAGAGGSSLGYRMAGFTVVWANEFVPAAQDSYRANMRPGTILDGRDVKTVKASDILKAAGLREGELDVFDGSPPCQAFSTAGRREKGWGSDKVYEHGAKQKNEELFFDYVRLRDGLQPRAFVAENVAGLVKGAAKGFFLEILERLKRGYRVKAAILDAQWLGVPQARQRVIFVGVREDLGLEPVMPAPLPYQYTVRDALPWIKRVVHDTGGQPEYCAGDVTNRPAPPITTGLITGKGDALNSRHFQVEAESDISRYAIGAEWDRLSPGQQSDRYFNLIKPDLDAPAPTIMASSGGTPSLASVVHPTEKRKFSIAELRRLCSFPDDFVLEGTYGQQWERLGNSVPPLMMRAVAEKLRDEVLLPARADGRKRTATPRRGRGKYHAATPPASDAASNPAGRSRRRRGAAPTDGA